MADGFRVDVGALVKAADGVVSTIQALGVKKVSDIDANKSAFGHDHLGGTVSNFCTRWEIGVENLTKDASEIAERLVRSAQAYVMMDDEGQSRMDNLLQGSGPDPGVN